MDQTPKYSQQLQGGREKRIQQHTQKRIQEAKDFKYKVMFGNSFCFLFSKTCFWKYMNNIEDRETIKKSRKFDILIKQIIEQII